MIHARLTGNMEDLNKTSVHIKMALCILFSKISWKTSSSYYHRFFWTLSIFLLSDNTVCFILWRFDPNKSNNKTDWDTLYNPTYYTNELYSVEQKDFLKQKSRTDKIE